MPDPTDRGAPNGAPASAQPDQRLAAEGATPGSSAAADRGKPAGEERAKAAATLREGAKEKLAGALDRQKDAAADVVERLAQTMGRSGEQFQGQQDWIASAIGRGADELSTLANAIRDKGLSDLAREVRSFARQRPALFMGAALAAGFAVARVGKVVAADLSRNDLPTMPEVGHAQP